MYIDINLHENVYRCVRTLWVSSLWSWKHIEQGFVWLWLIKSDDGSFGFEVYIFKDTRNIFTAHVHTNMPCTCTYSLVSTNVAFSLLTHSFGSKQYRCHSPCRNSLLSCFVFSRGAVLRFDATVRSAKYVARRVFLVVGSNQSMRWGYHGDIRGTMGYYNAIDLSQVETHIFWGLL